MRKLQLQKDCSGENQSDNFQFDEVQSHLRAQRRPSCERQHHLRGTGHCPARQVSTSKPHNESIKKAHLEKSRWAFFVCADLLNLMTLALTGTPLFRHNTA